MKEEERYKYGPYHHQNNQEISREAQQFQQFQEEEFQDQGREDQQTNVLAVNQQYLTNINQLITEPNTQNMSTTATNFILNSLFVLSEYLFRKKIQKYDEHAAGNLNKEEQLSFQSYLSKMESQFNIYGKGKKNKSREEIFQDVDQEEVIDQRNIFKNLKKQTFSFSQSQLVRCYQKVEGIYFEEKFFLNFSFFELCFNERKSKKQKDNESNLARDELETLNENLDLVEINLFSQIHRKFQEYFKVVANFDYLRESISIQLLKLGESRRRIKDVKRQYVQKSVFLRKKIIQRQNIEKTAKCIKMIKSLKKLPVIIQQILKSSLPYECLQLLEKTKSSLKSVINLKCLSNTALILKQCENMAQNDLSRRYANNLYLYLQECHLPQTINLSQIWKKIQTSNCLDRDSSMLMSQLNSSNLSESGMTDKSGMHHILEELDHVDPDHQLNTFAKNTYAKRNQGKEYEIAMILLQSYEFVTFTAEITKIKVTNALRVFVKKFEKQLAYHFKCIIKEELQERNHMKGQSFLTEMNSEGYNQIIPYPQMPKSKITVEQTHKEEDINDDIGLSSNLIEQISVDYYIRHIAVLNQIFKETINRFLGYIFTLLTEYEDQFNKNISMQKDRSHLIEKHRKFKHIFSEECSLLPSLLKIVEEKIKYLLNLKNISSISPIQFYRWVNTLRYWQKYLDYLVEDHPLINYNFAQSANIGKSLSQSSNNGQMKSPCCRQLLDELLEIIHENIRKSISTMKLKQLISELSINYINTFHENNVQNQIINSLYEENWKAADIPSEFSEILNTILYRNQQQKGQNVSLTILNSSTSSTGSNKLYDHLNKSDISDKESNHPNNTSFTSNKLKFKILKNNILITGFRYKVTVSFMVLMERISQYLKTSKLFQNILAQNLQNSDEVKNQEQKKQESIKNQRQEKYQRFAIEAHISSKLYDLIEKYCQHSKQLILEAKALKNEKFKAKNISGKHLCILCNCLDLTLKISKEMFEQDVLRRCNLTQRHKMNQNLISNLHTQILNRLCGLIHTKIQNTINISLQQEVLNPTNSRNIFTQNNTTLITSFIQMVEVLDQFLDNDNIRLIMRSSFQLLVQKYVTKWLLKGQAYRSQLEGFIEKMKFMKQYFTQEYDSLLSQIKSS